MLVALIFYAQCDTLTDEKPTYTVTTIINAPYTMLRESETTLTGNERFEGYLVDLIDLIAKEMGKYKLLLMTHVDHMTTLCNLQISIMRCKS